MTLNLLLLRHAKSSWASPGMDDHDRPLAPRGIAAAQIMGREIAARGLTPQLVLCSTAVRAQETWREASPSWQPLPPVETVEALYDFGDGESLLDVIKAHGGRTERLMVIGHNPAMEALALRLTGDGDPALRRLMAAKYPTAALAVIAFESEGWGSIGSGAGRLAAFLRPRDIGAPAGD